MTVDHLLTSPELATFLAVSVKTLDKWAYQGTGPSYFKVGNLRRYRLADVDRWLADNRVAS